MNKQELLEQIEKNVLKCKKCRLCENVLNAVPGEGNINAKLVFVGEAPGAQEDATGRPFVGRAGKLLDKLLVDIGMNREDVWIGNIIKHRPPNNRDPLPDELSACSPYLTMQLKAISPLLIVTLGRFSMNYFYAAGKISRDHGNLLTVGDYNIFPIYHPAAALRNRNFAKALVQDFRRIPEILVNLEERNTPKVTEHLKNGPLSLGI